MASPSSQDAGLDEQQAHELLIQARAGDDAAFGKLVVHYTPRLYRVVRRMTDDSEQAEAIVQETFLRAWQRLRSWRPPASLGGLGPEKPFFSYLVTIALNLARDQLRRDRRLDFGGLAPLENVLVDPQPGPESRLEESEILERLAQAVADLPPAYRVVIALRYDAGLSYQEISQALGIPLNTVRTHLRRAKTHLRKALRNAEE